KGGAYYLMSTTAADKNSRTFFDSFEFTPHEVSDVYEVLEDTNLFFTVNTIKKEDIVDYSSLNFGMFDYGYYEEDQEDKSYMDESEQWQHFHHKRHESVWVGYKKYRDYEGFDSLEQFWKLAIETLTDT